MSVIVQACRRCTPDYESGGQEFESLRARQSNQKLRMVLPIGPGAFRFARVHNQVHDRAGVRTRSCRRLLRSSAHCDFCVPTLHGVVLNFFPRGAPATALTAPRIVFLAPALAKALGVGASMRLAHAGEITYYGVLGAAVGKHARWPLWTLLDGISDDELAKGLPASPILFSMQRLGGRVGYLDGLQRGTRPLSRNKKRNQD
jgi:hypothetical protein